MPSTKLKTTPEHSWQFDAIGTKWEIVSTKFINNELKARTLREIELFNSVYSRFEKNSLVRTMAQQPGEYEFPLSAVAIFNYYDELWDITGHKVTPLVGDALASAGYDANYSLKPSREINPVLDYKKVVQRDGLKVRLLEKTQIDIGAVGKGYLVDEITRLFQNSGHSSFIVDGSGDMRVTGERLEIIGLENPYDTTEVIGTVELSGQALCASSSNRRAWGEWHHIIDPITARPTQDIVATWVIADTAMVADGLATALFFTSPQILAERYTYEYIRIHANGSIEYSHYFSKGIF